MQEGMEKLRISQEKTDLQIKAMQQELGGVGKSNGEFAEEYFINVFERDKTLAGMHFDEVKTNEYFKDREQEDEYDIVMLNDKNVAIIEIKYNARDADIDKVVKKAASFRHWFPEHSNHKIYLGLASMHFTEAIINQAKEKGIAIIRQRGGKVVVNDKNLVAY
jgi:hypothetical protein